MKLKDIFLSDRKTFFDPRCEFETFGNNVFLNELLSNVGNDLGFHDKFLFPAD